MDFLEFLINEVPELGCKDPVCLNIYDVHVISRFSSLIGLGLFHTGVVVFGQEFAFGGHDYKTTGIYKITPMALDTMTYRTTLRFNRTMRTQRDVFEFLVNMSPRYRGTDYNLFKLNCNHFADEFLYFLISQHLPTWINRVARYSESIMSGILPKTWIENPIVCSRSSHSSGSASESSGSATPNSSYSSSGEPCEKPIRKIKPTCQRPPMVISKKFNGDALVPAAEMNFQKLASTVTLDPPISEQPFLITSTASPSVTSCQQCRADTGKPQLQLRSQSESHFCRIVIPKRLIRKRYSSIPKISKDVVYPYDDDKDDIDNSQIEWVNRLDESKRVRISIGKR